MSTQNELVGFDRKIRLSWLDATADWLSQGLSVADIRTRLGRLLDGEVAGGGTHSARGKTITVLLHIWVLVPDELLSLRNDGLDVLRGLAGSDSDRALGNVHGDLSFLPRRGRNDWPSSLAAGTGASLADRPTCDGGLGGAKHRPASRTTSGPVVRILECPYRKIRTGVFASGPRVVEDQEGIGAWMLEAGLADFRVQGYRFHELAEEWSYFPLDIKITLRDINGNRRLEVRHQGFDGLVVTLRRTG